jgi:hypothetical protein
MGGFLVLNALMCLIIINSTAGNTKRQARGVARGPADACDRERGAVVASALCPTTHMCWRHPARQMGL